MVILEISSSVKFKHFNFKQHHTKPSNSTGIIKDVLHQTDWKQPFHYGIRFPINFQTKLHKYCQTYSYWDYQQAWFNALFLQKFKESHSCLFYFDNSINTTKIPNWFRQWWDYFGCITELHHPHPVVQKGYKLFKKNFRGTEGEKKFPPMLMFCSKFFVPWVCLWYFDYNDQNTHVILIRKYKVKWWDCFTAENKSFEFTVMLWLSLNNRHGIKEPPHLQDQSQSLFLTQKAHASALLATAKSKKEYFEVMKKLLDSGKGEFMFSSSPASSSSRSYTPLGNENEDNCYDILPSLQNP